MLKLLIIFPLLVLLSLTANAQVCPDAIFGVAPGGFKKVGGATIGEVDGKSYGIEHLCNGKFHKLLLQVDISPSGGTPQWQTLDVLLIPVGSDKFELVFGESFYPKLNGKLDLELVSLAKVTEDEFWISTKAWRAHRRKGKFLRLVKVQIKCDNPGYGV
ncbi:hypothetical protein [Geothrix campi]|uniref:hypothetical protein n=1 Tax=Geothrix campi TaxID=2966450 RepID=UPI002147BDA4|nr:hypothetical protein [Geothrix sp. SG10]